MAVESFLVLGSRAQAKESLGFGSRRRVRLILSGLSTLPFAIGEPKEDFWIVLISATRVVSRVSVTAQYHQQKSANLLKYSSTCSTAYIAMRIL